MFKLFVGGFSPETPASELKAFFSRLGKVTGFTIIFDKKTKASRGYGFLTCENKSTQEYILGLKTVDFYGRTIEINKAVDKSNEVPSDIKTKTLRKLFIGGLSPSTDSESLSKYFQKYGDLVTAYVILDPDTKASRNFGYVEFATVEGADAALRENPHTLHSRKITVERKKGEKIHSKDQTNQPKSKMNSKGKEKGTTKNSSPSRPLHNSEYKIKDPIGFNKKRADLNTSTGHHSDTQDSFKRHGVKKVDAGQGNLKDASLIEGSSKAKRARQPREEMPQTKATCSSKFMGNWAQSFYDYLVVVQKSESWQSHMADSDNITFHRQSNSKTPLPLMASSGTIHPRFPRGVGRAIGS